MPIQHLFINGIILYVAFVIGSYNVMFSLNERSLRKIQASQLFIRRYHSTVYPSIIDTQEHCLCFVAIKNNAAMSICVSFHIDMHAHFSWLFTEKENSWAMKTSSVTFE